MNPEVKAKKLAESKEETIQVAIDEDVEKVVSVTPSYTPPASPCDYLFIIRANACVKCKGVSCTASKDKKVSDIQYCKAEWPDCTIYVDAREAGVRPLCPYQGPPPEGRGSCTGVWCYARDRQVRVLKTCMKWDLNCSTFMLEKWHGKPFYRDKVM